MKRSLALLFTLVATASANAQNTAAPAATGSTLEAFGDAIHHWRNVHGDKYPRYAPDQVALISDNILLYQRSDGGWVENQDPARILDTAARAQYVVESRKTGGSFDNRNIYTQVEYLARAFALTGDARYRDASLRGLEFTLAHQESTCGGWPHTVPATERYHPYVTMADDVTSGVLRTLRRAATDRATFAFLDDALRARILQAVARGDECLLRLQVRQGGVLAGWAGQYDNATLLPAQGRKFELPAIAMQESVGVVRYLMEIPQPSPTVIAAIQGAAAWMQRVEITGWQIETFDAEPEQFQHHASAKDRRLVPDSTARGLWARFYDLQDNTVVLATRESQRVQDYAQIPRERRTGYEWYGHWPKKLLEREYPAWRSRNALDPVAAH